MMGGRKREKGKGTEVLHEGVPGNVYRRRKREVSNYEIRKKEKPGGAPKRVALKGSKTPSETNLKKRTSCFPFPPKEGGVREMGRNHSLKEKQPIIGGLTKVKEENLLHRT